MRKFYYLMLMVFGLQTSAQVVPITDDIFKHALLDEWTIALNQEGQQIYIDANNNGYIEESEALQVFSLKIDNFFIDAGWYDEETGDYYENNEYITNLGGLEYFTNLRYLEINKAEVFSVNVLPLIHLETLILTRTFITSLNVSTLPNLKKLDCHGAKISNLIMSSHPLEYLDYSYNLLNTVPVLAFPALLQTLIVSRNTISSLNLTGFSNLRVLKCSNNLLTQLDLSPSPLLQEVHCDMNNLSTINVSMLPALTSLATSNNPIGTLNISQNPNLKQLRCANNQLSTLNITGFDLDYLECSKNNLTSLDLTAKSNLKTLYCDDNHLTTLDFTDLSTINDIICGKNDYTTLDASMVKTTYFKCSDNPNLTYLNIKDGRYQSVPQLQIMNNPNLKYICTDESETTGVHNHVNPNGLNTVVVNSYCTFVPGGTFYAMNGVSSYDFDANGCDTSDVNVPYAKFTLSGLGAPSSFLSNEAGNYSMPVGAGNYTIAPVFENSSFFAINPANLTVSFPTMATPQIQNFCITPNGIHRDVDINIFAIEPSRPGFNATYKILYRNIGNMMVDGEINFSYDDAVIDFVSASQGITGIPAGTLHWTFANLLPFESREILVVFNLNGPMETPALNGGDILTFNGSAQLTNQTDENLADNTMTLEENVVNSYDPNDKTCLEGNTITPEMIGAYVHYRIRFENTGTFAAENIVVKDMIDTTKFDIASLVALDGSHPFVTRIGGNRVEFIFENINLPFDDQNNDGYVLFKIKTKSTLVLGNTFSNTASIYFDYNFPIITDPAVTTVAVLGVTDNEVSSFTVSPNPTSGVLNITAKNGAVVKSISVYNVLGQVVLVVPNAKGLNGINVSALAQGNYILKIQSDKGTSTAKFIKN